MESIGGAPEFLILINMTILEKDTNAFNLSFIIIPVEHLNILVGVLVELSDAAVDVLWDTVMAGMEDGLFHRLGQQHVLVRVFFQHPLQEKRPPRLLQLRPVLLAGFIELVLVRYVPYRLDVQPFHFLSAAAVDATVVEEEIKLVVVASRCSHLP